MSLSRMSCRWNLAGQPGCCEPAASARPANADLGKEKMCADQYCHLLCSGTASLREQHRLLSNISFVCSYNVRAKLDAKNPCNKSIWFISWRCPIRQVGTGTSHSGLSVAKVVSCCWRGGPGCAQGPLSLNSSTGTEPVGADIVSQAWMCPDMSGWPC